MNKRQKKKSLKKWHQKNKDHYIYTQQKEINKIFQNIYNEIYEEAFKVHMDKVIYGNGFYQQFEDGTIKHIPMQNVYEMQYERED